MNKLFKTLTDRKGFTLIEVLVASMIMLALVTVGAYSYLSLQKQSALEGATEEFMAIVKFARQNTVASDQISQYGVYINTEPTPHQYVLFKGATYAQREQQFDKKYSLPKTAEFFALNIGSGNFVAFERLTGHTQQSGSISIRLKAEPSQSKTVYVTSSGIVSLAAQGQIADTRAKDSRHAHIAYTRTINANNEIITLNFNGGAQITNISMLPYIINRAFIWEGTIKVSGEDQLIAIKTHKLNDSGTSFSIRRDLRHNTKPLVVTISGDTSGNLISYSADGLTTTKSSQYVSGIEWQ